MGHADIQATMIYAKWGKDRAADRALVDAAFAKGEPPRAFAEQNVRSEEHRPHDQGSSHSSAVA